MSEVIDMALAYLAVITACALVLGIGELTIHLYEAYKLWAEKKRS